MKVYVRHGDGELMFPSFKEFQAMYRLKFIAPDDLVRRETSERWLRAGDLPELRGVVEAGRMGRQFTLLMWLLVGFFALVILFQLFTLAHHR
jgi:hypothetical protein